MRRFIALIRRFAASAPCLLLLGLTLCLLPPQAQAQTEPFETIELRVSGTANVNRNFLHNFWNQGTGVQVALATPFYLGFVEAGSALHRYEAVGEVPGLSAVWLYAGWGLGLDLADRLRLEGSARIGNYHMSFDEASAFASVVNESELAVMLHARAALRAAGPAYIYVSGSYLQAYTFIRMKLWYVSAGVSFRLPSPNWLKVFLR